MKKKTLMLLVIMLASVIVWANASWALNVSTEYNYISDGLGSVPPGSWFTFLTPSDAGGPLIVTDTDLFMAPYVILNEPYTYAKKGWYYTYTVVYDARILGPSYSSFATWEVGATPLRVSYTIINPYSYIGDNGTIEGKEPVPEPATLISALLGLLGFAVKKFLRK